MNPTAKTPPARLFDATRNFLTILQGLWFLVLFNVLAAGAFLVAGQGADVLLCIAEDLGATAMEPMTAVWLLLALAFWSIASEFSSRFLLYLSDSSGRSISPQTVQQRRHLQQRVTTMALFLPSVIMATAYLKVLLFNYSDLNVRSLVAIAVIFGLLAAWCLLLRWLYYRGGIARIARRFPRLSWLMISRRERVWVNKLYGILHDVRVDLDRDAGFSGSDLRGTPFESRINFPDTAYLQITRNSPQADGPYQVWMYRIDRRFYACLFRQLYALVTVAVVLIVLLGIVLPVRYYLHVGAAAFICMAFGCWQVVYLGLHFADKVQQWVPIRLLLLLWLVAVSFLNPDHPLQFNRKVVKQEQPALAKHFGEWFRQLQADTGSMYYRNPQTGRIPVIFVTAEGGALRTGAFSAMLLARLQDSFPQFSRYIYAYSGVSGGALGSNYFYALTHTTPAGQPASYTRETKQFFRRDFLAAVTGKLVFAEIIGYFLPGHFSRLDRAIALEDAWAEAAPALSQPFDRYLGSAGAAMFINTTEVETGLQCLYANVQTDSLVLGKQRNLYNHFSGVLSHASAINLSTRFPLISPAGMYEWDTLQRRGNDPRRVTIRRHYVDGGYFENKGSETMLQVLKALPLSDYPVQPYVLQFNFGDKDTSIAAGIRSFNEFSEILNGIYNTRAGRGAVAQQQLEAFVQDAGGRVISLDLNLTSRQFPMNWILSNTAVNRLDTYLTRVVRLGQERNGQRKDTLDERDKEAIGKLFFYDLAYRRTH
jgi:hypothetical protein